MADDADGVVVAVADIPFTAAADEEGEKRAEGAGRTSDVRSSPSSARIAIVVPTGTLLVPDSIYDIPMDAMPCNVSEKSISMWSRETMPKRTEKDDGSSNEREVDAVVDGAMDRT